PPASSNTPSPSLTHSIANAPHRTQLMSSTTSIALYPLQRLGTRFIAACGSSGHRLSISTLKTEREMCSNLEWQLNVEPSALKDFEPMVWMDFKGLGPYPSQYTLPLPS
ncbi:hypothetical protein BJ322DRAFT_983112, partial [Thelephora terrestris]